MLVGDHKSPSSEEGRKEKEKEEKEKRRKGGNLASQAPLIHRYGSRLEMVNYKETGTPMNFSRGKRSQGFGPLRWGRIKAFRYSD